jgi:hypothetical protein
MYSFNIKFSTHFLYYATKKIENETKVRHFLPEHLIGLQSLSKNIKPLKLNSHNGFLSLINGLLSSSISPFYIHTLRSPIPPSFSAFLPLINHLFLLFLLIPLYLLTFLFLPTPLFLLYLLIFLFLLTPLFLLYLLTIHHPSLPSHPSLHYHISLPSRPSPTSQLSIHSNSSLPSHISLPSNSSLPSLPSYFSLPSHHCLLPFLSFFVLLFPLLPFCCHCLQSVPTHPLSL